MGWPGDGQPKREMCMGLKSDLRHENGSGMAFLLPKKNGSICGRTQKLVSHLYSVPFYISPTHNLAAIMSKPVTIKIKNGTVSVSNPR